MPVPIHAPSDLFMPEPIHAQTDSCPENPPKKSMDYSCPCLFMPRTIHAQYDRFMPVPIHADIFYLSPIHAHAYHCLKYLFMPGPIHAEPYSCPVELIHA